MGAEASADRMDEEDVRDQRGAETPLEVLMLVPTCELRSNVEISYDCQCLTAQYVDVYLQHYPVPPDWTSVHTVVLDEISQYGEELFARIVSRLPSFPSLRRVVFAGDQYQKRSVQPGNVPVDLRVLAPHVRVVELRTDHRVSSGKVELRAVVASARTNVDLMSERESACWAYRPLQERTEWAHIWQKHAAEPWAFQIMCWTNSWNARVNQAMVRAQCTWMSKLAHDPPVTWPEIYRKLLPRQLAELANRDWLCVGARVTLQANMKRYGYHMLRRTPLLLLDVVDEDGEHKTYHLPSIQSPLCPDCVSRTAVFAHAEAQSVLYHVPLQGKDAWSDQLFVPNFSVTPDTKQGGQCDHMYFVLESEQRIKSDVLLVAASRAISRFECLVTGFVNPLNAIRLAALSEPSPRFTVLEQAFRAGLERRNVSTLSLGSGGGGGVTSASSTHK